METITFNEQQTKPCPFCAETIQARAIKCRFCNEFLNTRRAQALETDPDSLLQPTVTADELDGILFEGRPSLFGMVGSLLKAAFFVALAVAILKLPAENFIVFITQDIFNVKVSNSQYFVIIEYKKAVAAGLIILVALILLLKFIKLKMTFYEVSVDRIEWSRGILDRRVDNIDMFRVVDLRLRRTILDCIFGIGTVVLITTDKTDPEFAFQKIRHSRRLYDAIKKASLEADLRNRVVHLE